MLRLLSFPAFAAVVALSLTACGGDRAPATTAGGEATTRTVTDARGDRVTVPAEPKRVVALSEPTLDSALALGLTPIATTAGRGQSSVPGYLQARAAGVASVGVLGQPDLERVAALRPDLILIDGTSIQDDALIKRLQAIAPTVYVSKTAEDWRTAFGAAATALGRSEEGKELLAGFDARADEIKGRLGDQAGTEVSVVRWSGIGLPATLKQEIAVSRVLAQLGLGRPASQSDEGPGHSVPISLERLDLLDGDWIFFASLGGGGPGGAGTARSDSTGIADSQAALEIARQTPGFDRLSAVRAGRVVPVDGSAWTSAGGLLAEEVVLDDVERTLAAGAGSASSGADDADAATR